MDEVAVEGAGAIEATRVPSDGSVQACPASPKPIFFASDGGGARCPLARAEADLPRSLWRVQAEVSEPPALVPLQVERVHSGASGTSNATSLAPSLGVMSRSQALVLSTTFEEMMSFPDPGLLRASSLSDVMHQHGAIFGDPEGSDKTYNLSHQVEEIDLFLSHNWSTPQLDKFLVLVVHFNWLPAFLVSALVLCVCCVLTATGTLPIVWSSIGECGVLCNVLTIPVFLLVLFHWHEVPYTWPGRKRVFLDKTCIHQTDDLLKKQGIAKLAAFLGHSSTLLCCYTEAYLLQLWTIYELATFLCVHPLERIVLLPTHEPRVFFFGVGIAYVSGVSVYFFPKPLDIIRWLATYLPAAVGYCWMLRRNAKRRAKVQSAVERFHIRQARCRVEDDRAFVECNVAAMMKYCGFVGEAADDGQALDAFDHMVHTTLPKAVVASLGRFGLPYRHQACILLLMTLPITCDNYFGEYYVGKQLLVAVILRLFQTAIHATTTIPLALAFCARMLETRMDAGRILEATMVVGCALLGFVWNSALFRFDTWVLQARAVEHTVWLLPTLAFDAVLVALTCWVYGDYRAKLGADLFAGLSEPGTGWRKATTQNLVAIAEAASGSPDSHRAPLPGQPQATPQHLASVAASLSGAADARSKAVIAKTLGSASPKSGAAPLADADVLLVSSLAAPAAARVTRTGSDTSGDEEPADTSDPRDPVA